MYHYLFTNDLRISNLDESLKKAGCWFTTNTVPSASKDKSANNNAMTLGFYFNLTESSNCAHAAMNGNIREVVLNFIKKFQFPNPRTTVAFNEAQKDGIKLAPMRIIVKVLYTMNFLNYNLDAYLTTEEIKYFIFYNDKIAKIKDPDINLLIDDILSFRRSKSYPLYISTNESEHEWKQEERQIREMLKILTWSGCISENGGKFCVQIENLSVTEKADVFDIITCNAFWEGSTVESYREYMDLPCIPENHFDAEINNNELQNDPEDLNKRAFEYWMKSKIQTNNVEEIYNQELLIKDYVKKLDETFLPMYDNKSVFFTRNQELVEITIDGLSNDKRRYAVKKYLDFIIEEERKTECSDFTEICYNTSLKTDYEMNRIIFGAPGTGKSHKLKEDCKDILSGTEGTFERVTFHPDYTYSQFVGTYKPVSEGEAIKYEYIPGPFMRVLVDAYKSGRKENPQPHVLVIEEINRAKVAAVFGDVFQLLDRDDNGVSEYEIQTSEDIRKYLASKLGGEPENYSRIKLPNNMFIWATMNSADQGVYPMDTAFKRRWNFEYLGINQNEDKIDGEFTIDGQMIKWNALRRAINYKLSVDFKVNEDKLMGPFFISKKLLSDEKKFIEAFKNKVLMYLYEDAAKQYKHRLFSGCDDTSRYSAVCNSFDSIGIKIFGDDFESVYYEQQRK